LHCSGSTHGRTSKAAYAQRLFAQHGCTHLYLLASVADDTLKKVQPHSVATALASMVLPVPGGPNSMTPCSTHARNGFRRILTPGRSKLRTIDAMLDEGHVFARLSMNVPVLGPPLHQSWSQILTWLTAVVTSTYIARSPGTQWQLGSTATHYDVRKQLENQECF
jgi:hypothetical protein